ncbi:MAG: polysaccharide biosynthesis/export family protein [Desulforhabdus sp.]|nr:polysaccharide biosynthesis/export family protein [Desulforhabdus sp.]
MSRLFISVSYFDFIRVAVVFVALVCFLSGCLSTGPDPTSSLDSILAKEGEAQQQTQHLNEKLFSSVKDFPNPSDYTVGEGDLLQVTVFGEEDLSSVVRVTAEGSITLPLIGSFKAEGHTTQELKHIIENAYGQKYLQDPHVQVFIKEQQGGKITLLGAVAKPGTYDYFSRQPLLTVLAMAGGMSQNAGTMVQVRRAKSGSEKESIYIVDLDQLVDNREEHLNMIIQPGDVVFVAEAGTLYIGGAISKPGSYPIRADMSVQEAIMSAGGTSWYASDNIKLIRYIGDGKREVTKLSAKDLGPAGFKIQDRDVLFVETNPIKQAVYGFRFSFFGTGIALTPPR